MKNTYWFKRRRYGYGWTPATAQGWTVLGVYLLAIFSELFLLDPEHNPELYFGIFGFLTLALIAISMLKGPKPKWRWGTTEQDDPEKDF